NILSSENKFVVPPLRGSGGRRHIPRGETPPPKGGANTTNTKTQHPPDAHGSLTRCRLSVNTGHLSRRVFDDARRLDRAADRVGRRDEASLRLNFCKCRLLLFRRPVFLLSGHRDHPRQLPAEQPGDRADQPDAKHKWDKQLSSAYLLSYHVPVKVIDEHQAK